MVFVQRENANILWRDGTMRYVVEKNFVQVIGKIWMPSVTCAMEYPLRPYDIENIGELTRENVEFWLLKNAGDFQSIEDFRFSVGDFDSGWRNEESEITYNDCVYGLEN
jgi:hypothetical protein